MWAGCSVSLGSSSADLETLGHPGGSAGVSKPLGAGGGCLVLVLVSVFSLFWKELYLFFVYILGIFKASAEHHQEL